MNRKQELLEKLKETPTDSTAFENLVTFHLQRGDFVALYEALESVAESLQDGGELAAFKALIPEVLRRHAESAPDPIVEAHLKVRLAGLLSDKEGQTKEALILLTEAFERLPSEDAARQAAEMLKATRESALLVQLLQQKSRAEEGLPRQADTLMQLGYAAVGSQNVLTAKEAFEALEGFGGNFTEKAAEGLKLVEKTQGELEESIETLEESLGRATDEERVVIKEKLGRAFIRLGRHGEGIPLLEEVLDRTQSEAVFMELVLGYKEKGRWDTLSTLLEEWVTLAQTDETRKELLKELARITTMQLDDRKRGYAAISELYKQFPGISDVVDFSVNLYNHCEDYEAMAELLGRARKDSSDRGQERRYLEWEAALRWRKLDQFDEAEKLYRRIKSIDPRNEASLIFYEELYRQSEDWRKLYSVLSTRQSLVAEDLKVDILRSMAEIARDHLNSPDRAIDSLRKILVLVPEDDDAFQELTGMLEEAHRWHAVIELYTARVDRLLDEDSEEKLELLQRIRGIYSTKDKLPVPEMVVNIDRRVLQIAPDNREALDALGDYYRKNNRWGELAEILEQQVVIEEDDATRLSLHTEIARLLIEYQHQESAAIPHLEQVVSLNAEDEKALSLLAKAYRTRGNIDGYLEIGRRQLALVVKEKRKTLLEELATVSLEQQGHEEDASEFLEGLYDLDPEHPWAFRRMRKLYETAEMFDRLADVLGRERQRVTTDSKRRSLSEKLGAVLADKLHRYEEAKGVFYGLLDENPNNRQAKRYLQSILAQAGEFDELESIYRAQDNLPGLLRFLDEFRQKEEDPEHILNAGLEMVRIAEEELDDSERAMRILESLLEQLPENTDVAGRLLSLYPEERQDKQVVRALTVLADHAEGEQAHEAAVRLADALEATAQPEKAYARTLTLFMGMARDGDLSLMVQLVERATRSDSLEGLSAILGDLIGDDLSSEANTKIAVQVASIYGSRLKKPEQAEEVLKEALEQEPDSLEVLNELERLHMASSNWASMEETVRRKADLMMDLSEKSEELFKLARLYEEIVSEPEKAADVYDEIRQLDPENKEATDGLKRILEELEAWDRLVTVLDEEIQIGSEPSRQKNLTALAALQIDKLSAPEAGATVLQQLVESWPEDEGAWARLADLFERDEALDVVLPLLEKEYERTASWEELVAVLNKKALSAQDDMERYDSFDRCARVLHEELHQAASALQYLTRMVSVNSGDPDLIDKLEEVAREAGEELALFSIYKGLLQVGESEFEAQEPLDTTNEYAVALRLANLASELDEFDVAIEALQRARDRDPSSLELLERLESLLEVHDHPEALLTLLEEKRDLVLDTDAKVELSLKVADLLSERLDRPEDSIEWLESVVDLVPSSLENIERLERLYITYKRWGDLTRLLEQKMGYLDGSDRRNVAYQLGVVARDQLNDLEQAYLNFSQVISEEPDNDLYLEALGSLLLMRDHEHYESVAVPVIEVLEPLVKERQNWHRLCEILEAKAVLAEEDNKRGQVFHQLGTVQRDHLNDMDAAFEAFAHAVNLLPGGEEVLEDFVAAAASTGRQDDLIAALEEGLGDIQESTETTALSILASALDEAGTDSKKTIACFERLLELNPSQVDGYKALERLYREEGNDEGRIRVLRELVERLDESKRGEALVTLGELQFQNDDMEDAVDSLSRAVAQGGTLPEELRTVAFHLLFNALETQERWFDLSQALGQQLEFVKDLDARKAILFRLAELEENRLENQDKAVEHYRSIVALDPDEEAATEVLFKLLDQTGRYTELEQLLSDQAELTTDEQSRRSLLERLAQIRLEELTQPDQAMDALGRLVEDGHRDQKVIGLLQQVLETYPEVGFRASQLLENIFRSAEMWEELVALLELQLEQFQQEVDPVERLRELARIHEEHFEDVEKAMDCISEAFKLEPESQSLHDQMVSYARLLDRFKELFDIYVDVLGRLDLPEERNQLRKKMSVLYHDELHDVEHAEFIYRDILDDEPGDEFALTHLETLYSESEEWDKLVETLRLKLEASRSDKVRIATLFEIAMVYRGRLENLSEALDTYEELLATDPKQWDAYRSIESIHFEKGDAEGVISIIRRELDNHESVQERRELRLRLASLLLAEVQDYESCLDEILMVLSEHPEDGAAFELLAELVFEWSHPSMEAVERLKARYVGADDYESLVRLYQHMVSGAPSDEEKVDWLEKMFLVRTEELDDPVGAYAVAKISLTLVPQDMTWRERLLQYAAMSDQVHDLVDYLESLLSDEAVLGTDLEMEYRFLFGQVLETPAQDPEGAVEQYRLVADSGISDLATIARERVKNLYKKLESWPEYVELVEQMAADAPDPEQRRSLQMEAALIAWETLEDYDRAQSLLATLCQERPDDEECQDRYEQLLVQLEKPVELESLLRQRVDVAQDSAYRVEIRSRLANLLLSTEDRVPEGIQELLINLEEAPAFEATWNMLEALLQSDATVLDDRILIAQSLVQQAPEGFEQERLVGVLEIHLELEEGDVERNRLHLQLADIHEEQGHTEQAFHHAGESLKLFPGVREVENRLRTLAEDNEFVPLWRDLLAEVAQGVEESTLKIHYLEEAAMLEVTDLDRPEQAARLYSAILDWDEFNRDALLYLEEYHRSQQSFEQLAGILEKLVGVETEPEARLSRTLTLARLYIGDYPDAKLARRWWEELQHTPEARLEALAHLVDIYEDGEEWELLADVLLEQQEDVEDEVEQADAVRRLAALHEERLDNLEEAFRWYGRLVELTPGDLSALEGWKRCALQLEDWEALAQADDMLLSVVSEEARPELQRELTGLLIERLGRKEEGLEHLRVLLLESPVPEDLRMMAMGMLGDDDIGFDVSLALEPVLEDALAWDELATLYDMQLGSIPEPDGKIPVALKAAELRCDRLSDVEGAFDVLHQLFAELPGSEELRDGLFDVARKNQRFDRFVSILEDVTEHAQDSQQLLELLHLIGKTWREQLGDLEEGGKWFRRMLDESPANVVAIQEIESIYEELGQFAEMAAFYEDLMLDLSGNERIPYLLKNAFLKEGQLSDLVGAIQAYKEVLELQPDNLAAMNRLDGMLDNPILGLSAIETLEPLYRQSGDPLRLARLLKSKAAEVEGHLDRSQLFSEAAETLLQAEDQEEEAFETYLKAIAEGSFDPASVLQPAESLAEMLDRWSELAETLENVLRQGVHKDLEVDLLRRLALFYMEKLDQPKLARERLQSLLDEDPNNSFALNLLARVLGILGDAQGQSDILEKLADGALDAGQKRDSYQQAAQLALDEGNHDQAANLLHKALLVNPDDATIMEQLSGLYRLLERYEDLVELLENQTALREERDTVEALLEAAHVATEHLNSPSRSLGLARGVLEREPDNKEALVIVTDVLKDQGRQQEAMSYLEHLAELSSGTELLDILWRLYESAAAMEDIEGAQSYLGQILDQAPDDERAQQAKIDLLRKGDDLHGLVSAFEERASEAQTLEERIELWLKAATILSEELTDADGALDLLAQILDEVPDHLEALKKKALLLIQHKRFEDAVEVYELIAEATQGEERAAAFRSALRLAANKLKDWELVELHAGELLESAPHDSETVELMMDALEHLQKHDALGELLLQEVAEATEPGKEAALSRRLAALYEGPLKNEDDTASWLQRAFNVEPTTEVADKLLAWYRKTEDMGQVVLLLEWKVDFLAAKRRTRDIPALLVELGELHRAEGNEALALEAYERAVETDGTHLPAIYRRAMLLVEDESRREEALGAFQTLMLRVNDLESDKQRTDVYLQLARIYAESGEGKRAKGYLNRLLALDENHAEAKALLETLG